MTKRGYPYVTLSVDSPDFKQVYGDIHEILSWVEPGKDTVLEFETPTDARIWRRRAYECMAITGYRVRVEWDGTKLTLRAKTPPATPIPTKVHPGGEADLPPQVSQQDEERVRGVVERTTQDEEVEDEDIYGIFK